MELAGARWLEWDEVIADGTGDVIWIYSEGRLAMAAGSDVERKPYRTTGILQGFTGFCLIQISAMQPDRRSRFSRHAAAFFRCPRSALPKEAAGYVSKMASCTFLDQRLCVEIAHSQATK